MLFKFVKYRTGSRRNSEPYRIKLKQQMISLVVLSVLDSKILKRILDYRFMNKSKNTREGAIKSKKLSSSIDYSENRALLKEMRQKTISQSITPRKVRKEKFTACYVPSKSFLKISMREKNEQQAMMKRRDAKMMEEKNLSC